MKKRYIFTFESGGWNTVMATNIRSAKKIIRETYPDSGVNFDSVRVISYDDYNTVINCTR